MVNQKKRYSNLKFQKGHTYHRIGLKTSNSLHKDSPKPWLPRLSEEDYRLVVKQASGGRMSLPDAEGVCTGGRLLRPRPQTSKEEATSKYLEGDGTGEMRLIHRDRNEDMWNRCYWDHNHRDRNTCPDPHLVTDKEIKKGLCWAQSLKCTMCDYRSATFKLYESAQSSRRGPKYAKPNLGLQVGLQDCAIGNTKVQMLLASTNTPPPSLNTLQKTSNKVGTITAAAADKDLKARCLQLKEVNKIRGLADDAPVNIAIDVRYNSNTIASRGKMGQNASQAIGVAIETMTDTKQIVGVFVDNKLCNHGAWLQSKGFKVTCPGGHAGCTATSKAAEPFSEYDIGKKIGQQIAQQDILVKHVTTDGDGRSCEGVQAAMSELNPLWEVVRQADTTHLGQGLFRHTLKASFSDDMFPAESRAEQRDQQKMFALDLKHRCYIIFQAMYDTCTGDITKIAKRMPTVIEATIDCYAGDCQNCRRQSVVCSGGKKNWLSLSRYLKVCGVTSLNLDDQDRCIVRELLRFYLGSAALKLIKLNSNTNKNEAVNRAISASLPKNVNFSRNARPRTLSAVCRLNKGAGNSLVESLEEVGSPISSGGHVAKSLQQIEHRSSYLKQYARSQKAKTARRKRAHMQMEEHYKVKKERRILHYAKGQLDPCYNI